jgi:hypothetical protein
MGNSTTGSLRDTELYGKMSSYLATAYAEGFCEGEGASEEDQLIAWQWLHDKKLAYSLQGWFGRQATSLIEQGLIAA